MVSTVVNIVVVRTEEMEVESAGGGTTTVFDVDGTDEDSTDELAGGGTTTIVDAVDGGTEAEFDVDTEVAGGGGTTTVSEMEGIGYETDAELNGRELLTVTIVVGIGLAEGTVIVTVSDGVPLVGIGGKGMTTVSEDEAIG